MTVVSLSASCGGYGPTAATATPTVGTATTTAGTATPTPTPSFEHVQPRDPCAESGTPRDAEGRVAASLALGLCLQALDGSPLTIETRLRDQVLVESIGGGNGRFNLHPRYFDPKSGGCDPVEVVALRADREIALTVRLACVGAQTAEGCSLARQGRGGFVALLPGRGEGESCLQWMYDYRDAQGYRVEMTYYRGRLVYAYWLPAGATVLHVPDDAAPNLSESLERCLERKDVTVSVFAILGDGGDRLVTSESVTSECGW